MRGRYRKAEKWVWGNEKGPLSLVPCSSRLDLDHMFLSRRRSRVPTPDTNTPPLLRDVVLETPTPYHFLRAFSWRLSILPLHTACFLCFFSWCACPPIVFFLLHAMYCHDLSIFVTNRGPLLGVCSKFFRVNLGRRVAKKRCHPDACKPLTRLALRYSLSAFFRSDFLSLHPREGNGEQNSFRVLVVSWRMAVAVFH